LASPFTYLVLDNKIVPFEDAKVHIEAPAIKYGAVAFEGIRGYWNEGQGQLFIFRCKEHMARLLQSGRLMSMDGLEAYTAEGMTATLLELLRANDVRQDLHIRPSLLVVGNGPQEARGPIAFSIVLVPMKRWTERPFKLQVSAWRRIDDNSIPPRIKAAANYQNGRLALIQAKHDGYDGVVMLDAGGHVTEEPRGCLFIVRGGRPITPPVTADILESITRDSLIQVFREQHGIEVEQRTIDRTELYVADEVFMCGTGLEVTTVAQVDRFTVAAGDTGPVTAMIRDTYMGITRGDSALYPEWRTAVYG